MVCESYEQAKRHWQELCEVQIHYRYYQEVPQDENFKGLFVERQLNYMQRYTQEFIAEMQNDIKDWLRDWHGV